MKRFIGLLAVVLAIAGCSSTSTTTNPTPAPQSIYVGNVGNNSISVFPPGSNGNVAPTATITGAATSINEPYYLWVDSAGKIWSSNWTGGAAGSITAYSAGSTGNVAPVVNLTGAATNLIGPCGIYVDATGKLYEANCSGASVGVFSPGSTGNVAPAQFIQGATTNLGFPEGLAVDTAGNIWVGDCGAAGHEAVYKWPNNATGNVAPSVTITYAPMTCVDGVAVDGNGRVYAAQDSGGAPGADAIYVFAAGANGLSTPVQTIQGVLTKLNIPYSVQLDNAGNIWVGNSDNVEMFPASANGNVAPTVFIQGANTLVNEPWGVALH
ncbi:MAG TPA: hypothetical protein VGX02_03540 [Candidatus Eremiobacteraceae bacterium]|nr:hypothetical protein [Candidatus Eremiobacteraceae bacterium]